MKTVLMPGPFSFNFRYGQPVEELVQEARFELLNPYINNQNFPPSQTRPRGDKLDGYLAQFYEGATEEDVYEVAKSQELRPATVAELIAFGIKFPNEYKRVAIIALGQKWEDPDGNDNVAYVATELYEGRPHSACNLGYALDVWPRTAVFLLV